MATSTFACDENNDLYLPDGRNLMIISGAQACAQNIKQKSLMRKGENQFNVNDGVDYLGAIFTPLPSYDAARKTISDNILACPDVISIEQLTITIAGEVFSYQALVNTVYGPTNVGN